MINYLLFLLIHIEISAFVDYFLLSKTKKREQWNLTFPQKMKVKS